MDGTRYESPSRTLLRISDICSYLLIIVATTLYGLVVWTVSCKSPAAMGAYKWYLIVHATNYMLLEWLYVIGHPEPAFPYSVVLGRGLAGVFRPSDFFCHLYMDLFILLIAGGFYTTAVLFALRYGQTVDNWLFRMLSSLKWAVSFNTFALVVGVGTVVVPIHMQWESSEELMRFVKMSDAELYGRMSNVAFVGFKTFNWQGYLALYAAMAGSAVIGAVDLWGTVGSYYYLRKNRNSLSDRTVALYRVLINVLVADMSLSLFIGFVPMALTFAALLLRWHDGASVAVLALTVCMWYPCCANAILLSYVKPYRMAVRGLFRFKRYAKLFGTRNVTVASVTGVAH